MENRVAFHNLGCKVNAYELDRIAGSLLARGYKIVPFSEEADIYIVNTCTVTNIADRKSRQMLHRAKKRNPRALVVALGCYVDTDPAGVEKDPCIDIALGNRDKEGLAEVLQTRAENETSTVTEKNGMLPVPCTGSGAAEEGGTDGSGYRSRTRAFLKIQDGCNLFCAYCIIPYARGRSTSRPAADVLKEAALLAACGVREIVLTGIHISSYGFDFETKKEQALTELILRINEIDGIRRIRLGSLEPRLVTREATEAMRQADKLCPHFHLSLQSGCDAVLKRMRRRYTTDEFAHSVALLREAFDHPAITTDVICGFPGETREEFEESRSFIEKTGFYETHVFPFSARKGTSAAGMKGQLTQKEKAARAGVLLELNAKNARAYRARFLDMPLRVLWEEKEIVNGKTVLTGHTEHYVKVAIPAEETESRYPRPIPQCGEITCVTAVRFLTDEILLAQP